jgi:hypothetical protein
VEPARVSRPQVELTRLSYGGALVESKHPTGSGMVRRDALSFEGGGVLRLRLRLLLSFEGVYCLLEFVYWS